MGVGRLAPVKECAEPCRRQQEDAAGTCGPWCPPQRGGKVDAEEVKADRERADDADCIPRGHLHHRQSINRPLAILMQSPKQVHIPKNGEQGAHGIA